MDRVIRAPTTRFILLSELKPLLDDSKEQTQLYHASWSEVEAFVGDPYGSQDDFTNADAQALVFLGIDESNGMAENGVAYWALDVTPAGPRKPELEELHSSMMISSTMYLLNLSYYSWRAN